MEPDVKQVIQQRFAELPPAVQAAVTDASVEKKLRALAAKYQLHLDKWVLLENEIMMTLLGIDEPENMAKNVAEEVGVSQDIAQQIVNDIALQIFKPIREQMQGKLDHEATERDVVPVKPQKTAPSDTTAYKAGENSAERRDVQEDPYRESIE